MRIHRNRRSASPSVTESSRVVAHSSQIRRESSPGCHGSVARCPEDEQQHAAVAAACRRCGTVVLDNDQDIFCELADHPRPRSLHAACALHAALRRLTSPLLWMALSSADRVDRDDVTLSDAARHQIRVATATRCSRNVSSGPCSLAMCHVLRAPCTQVVLMGRCLSDVRGRYRSFLKNTRLF